jgi:hypothetical protein
MLLLAALLIASAPTPAVAQPDAMRPAVNSRCPRTANYHAYRDGKPLSPHKLTELPPANAYSAVFRQIGGCEAPIVVKYGVGGR